MTDINGSLHTTRLNVFISVTLKYGTLLDGRKNIDDLEAFIRKVFLLLVTGTGMLSATSRTQGFNALQKSTCPILNMSEECSN